MRRIDVRQTYRDPNGRERGGRSLGPFDEADRILEVRLEVAPLCGREALEAEQVEVRDVGITRVAVADGKCRAGDWSLDAERAAGTANERRLAAAELARDGDNVAAAELTRERGGNGLRLVGRR
jgi:hypothetical protein